MVYDVADHLVDLHERCKRLLVRYLQRYWYRAAQGAGGLGDLFVTIEEVSAELGAGPMAPPIPLDPPEVVAERLAHHRRAVSERAASNPALPAHELAHRAGLDAETLELLLVPNALQRSPGLLRVCTFAWADFSLKQPTVAFLVELLADDQAHQSRLERSLAPDAPLRVKRLLELGEDKRWQPATPLLQRPVFVPDAVKRFLEGQPVLDDAYKPGIVRLEASGPHPEHLVLHDPDRLVRVLSAISSGVDRLPVLLIGEPGSGRRTVARAHALAAGRTLFVVDVSGLPWELEAFEHELAAIMRDGFLSGSVLLLRCECFEERTDRRPAILGRLIRTMGVPTVLTVTARNVPFVAPVVPDVHVCNVEDAPPASRARLYGHLLGLHAFEVPVAEVAGLADGYKLRPGDLDRALRDVRTVVSDGQLDTQAFDRAVRRQIRTNLSALASPVTTSQTWDDLVVADEQWEVVKEILVHARQRTLVFEEWGFSRKLGSRGRGLSCLFSGPPGTGKTMTSALVAKELGLDLYQVDLSRIVDKYVGETEKNLARLFDEASRVPVVLLFDEADSLFATRTKVESSNDRYANLEVNFLLQRMETYEGISILTTNLGTGIDQAFKRRLRFRLHFDLPGAEEREVLWKSMVPPGCKVETVDWGFLAKKWEMSGAIIRNAMVRAAFLAADRGTALSDELLQQAARAELMELGRLG